MRIQLERLEFSREGGLARLRSQNNFDHALEIRPLFWLRLGELGGQVELAVEIGLTGAWFAASDTPFLFLPFLSFPSSQNFFGSGGATAMSTQIQFSVTQMRCDLTVSGTTLVTAPLPIPEMVNETVL